MSFPTEFQLNAWAGPDITNQGPVSKLLSRSFLAAPTPSRSRLLGPRPVNLDDWRNPDVGWGIVLPDDPDRKPADKAGIGLGDPEPLRALLTARGDGPVLRYAKDAPAGTLRRYYTDGNFSNVSLAAQYQGTGRDQIPRYLLICASPAQIPWSVQFEAQFSCFTGRLDLTGTALENYVTAAVSGWTWDHTSLDPKAMTLWSVIHSDQDITQLLYNTVIAPLYAAIKEYQEYKPQLLMRDAANAAGLTGALGTTHPAFVATASHGATHPLSDAATMQGQLGLLVDKDYALLRPADLLAAWQPNGAIWYAHACCSAGANARSVFSTFVPADGSLAKILNGVAACGAMTAPLPTALLGAARPLRAFIGHVEPTFDWTLRRPDTRQYMTMPIISALFERLYGGMTLGHAMDECRRASAALTAAFTTATMDFDAGVPDSGQLLFLQLMARDWDSLVILGDPAATLPCAVD